jgi:hypothetical protein
MISLPKNSNLSCVEKVRSRIIEVDIRAERIYKSTNVEFAIHMENLPMKK